MAIDAFTVFVNTNGVVFPDTEAVNSSGALATDGTEFVKLMIDNYMFGRQQALLNHVGLTPNGISEADGASQEILALQRMGMHPGQGLFAFWNDTPSNLGIRVLMLTGQGILRANYADLDSFVYVGDGNNPTASTFYHADDAAGTIRNTAGVYLILPDARGQTIRGLDLAAAVDPDGASRDLGHLQLDAMQRITGTVDSNYAVGTGRSGVFGSANTTATRPPGGTSASTSDITFNNANSISPNAAKTSDSESRMTNMACDIGIIY